MFHHTHNSLAVTLARDNFRINLATPVHRLPDELLSLVFLAYCGEIPPHGTSRFSRHIPYGRSLARVCSVCRVWRAAAHQTPQLWSYIALMGPKGPLKHRKQLYLQMLQTHLERSGAQSLEVFLEVGSHFPTECLSLLRPHMPRIRGLTVNSVTEDFLPHLFPLSNVSRLEELSLSAATVESDNFDLSPHVTISMDAPLEKLAISFAVVSLGSGDFPTSRLRSVIMHARAIDDMVIPLLSSCPLDELDMRVAFWDDSRLSSDTLTRLTIHVTGEITLESVIDTAPNLLHLTAIIETSLSALAPEWSLLPNLRSLITQSPGNSSHGVAVLRNAPQLVALEVWDNSPDEILEFLVTPSASQSYPCDNLRLVRLVLRRFVPLETARALCIRLLEERPHIRVEWHSVHHDPLALAPAGVFKTLQNQYCLPDFPFHPPLLPLLCEEADRLVAPSASI